MATLYQACKEIVKNAIDDEYLDGKPLKSVYISEYGNYRGISPKECTNYLQGLPSVCAVPFSNFEILSILEEKYDISRKTENGQIKLVEDYWRMCGYVFYKMINK